MKKATAVLLAGSRPGRDPFASAHGTDLKPLISVGGVPMVRRPVEALLASDGIASVVVLTQSPDRIAAVLPAEPRLDVAPSSATIAETLLALCDDAGTQWPLLVTTADHALLSPAMVGDFLGRALDSDIAVGLVERRNLLARLPETSRTWIRFRGEAWSGANLFLLAGPQVRPALELWRSVEQDRKKAWKLLSLLSPSNALSALLRLRTLDETLMQVGKRLGLRVRPVAMSDPLAAVDVDKEADLELVEAILAGRA